MTTSDAKFDPEALRAKYRAERDKRIRGDGNEQYREVKGAFASFADDPYVVSGFMRAPLTDEVAVVVVGGGFGGLLAGARLREAGVDDLRMIEKGGDFGGTWYWNRYPGAMCDVESYIYLPLLEEFDYLPDWKYSFGNTIRAHAEKIADRYCLREDALFQTSVTGARWDNNSRRWVVSTDRGDSISTQ